MGRNLTGTQIVENAVESAKKRRAQALAWRNSGLTVEQVGDKLGVSKQRASELLAKARKENNGA